LYIRIHEGAHEIRIEYALPITQLETTSKQ
jgi:hypothetical protein